MSDDIVSHMTQISLADNHVHLKARIEELEAACWRMMEERDRAIGWRDSDKDRADSAEAKLARGVLAEYDDGVVISLSSFAGGASEGGSWSTLTLIMEGPDGAVSFRDYSSTTEWRNPLAELTGGKND